MVLTLDGKLWYLLGKELDVSNRNNSHGTLSIITKKNEKEDYSYEKDQEISCYTVSGNNGTCNGSDSICSGWHI